MVFVSTVVNHTFQIFLIRWLGAGIVSAITSMGAMWNEGAIVIVKGMEWRVIRLR